MHLDKSRTFRTGPDGKCRYQVYVHAAMLLTVNVFPVTVLPIMIKLWPLETKSTANRCL